MPRRFIILSWDVYKLTFMNPLLASAYLVLKMSNIIIKIFVFFCH